MKLVIALALVLVVGTVSMCGFQVYKLIDEFPEEARFENLNRRYANLVTNLNTAIDKSDSAFALANELENIKYPPDAISVSMRKDDDDEKDEGLSIFNRLEKKNRSGSSSRYRAVLNGGGHGSINGQYFLILQHPVERFEYDHIEILFERDKAKVE